MKVPKRKLVITAAGVSAAVILALGALAWVTKGTAVSKQDVIAAYERDKKGGSDESEAIVPETIASAIPAGLAPRATVHRGGAAAEPVVADGRKSGWPLRIRPAEGIYLYDTEGGERIQGLTLRQFPAVTRRYIYHRSAQSEWGDHHLFLEERKTWGEFRFGAQGRMALSTRQYVAFGPQKEDRTIVFEPPALTSPVPWRSGQTWEGSYSGKVYGEYRGRSEAKEMRLEGKTYQIWADTMHVSMRGEVEGEVNVERWISPDTGITFFEHYVADARVQAFIYSAEWKVRLRSVTPEYQ